MEDENLELEIQEAEQSIAEAEKELGPDSGELADKLSKYATLLRRMDRVLDAVNVEARARSIRAKIYAAEVESQTPVVAQPEPLKLKKAHPAAYIGLLAVFVALATLFVDQQFFLFMLPICIILSLVDIVATRGQWWRAAVCFGFLAWGWWGIKSLPDEMLVTATPLDRLNYEVNHPHLVSLIKKLGKDTRVLSYRLRPPADFGAPSNEQVDWGRVFTWKGAQRSDGSMAVFSIMVMTVPDDVRKNFAAQKVMKLAKDIATPRALAYLHIDEIKQDAGEVLDLNGLDFALINWSSASDQNQDLRGFIYVAKDHRTLVTIAGVDSIPYCEDSLKAMDASVYTFRKPANAAEVDIY